MRSFIRRFKGRLRHTPLMPLLRPRRFQAYCVGLPKTGTTSIGMMFRSNYRSAHEPLPERTRDYVLQAHEGRLSRPELHEYLRWRDRDLYLEMESSHPIAVFVEDLVELFPDSQFILTVRSPRSWVQSFINEELKSRAQWATMAKPGWRAGFFPRYYDLCCGRTAYGSHDQPLERLGLYPLDGYLRWWRDHNAGVLAAVPGDRLLVVRTERLSEEVERLASFLGVDAGTLDIQRSHANRANRKRQALDDVDPQYLKDRVDFYCRDVLDDAERLANEQPAREPAHRLSHSRSRPDQPSALMKTRGNG